MLNTGQCTTFWRDTAKTKTFWPLRSPTRYMALSITAKTSILCCPFGFMKCPMQKGLRHYNAEVHWSGQTKIVLVHTRLRIFTQHTLYPDDVHCYAAALEERLVYITNHNLHQPALPADNGVCYSTYIQPVLSYIACATHWSYIACATHWVSA